MFKEAPCAFRGFSHSLFFGFGEDSFRRRLGYQLSLVHVVVDHLERGALDGCYEDVGVNLFSERGYLAALRVSLDLKRVVFAFLRFACLLFSDSLRLHTNDWLGWRLLPLACDSFSCLSSGCVLFA